MELSPSSSSLELRGEISGIRGYSGISSATAFFILCSFQYSNGCCSRNDKDSKDRINYMKWIMRDFLDGNFECKFYTFLEQLRCSASTNWATESSCRVLTARECKLKCIKFTIVICEDQNKLRGLQQIVNIRIWNNISNAWIIDFIQPWITELILIQYLDYSLQLILIQSQDYWINFDPVL